MMHRSDIVETSMLEWSSVLEAGLTQVHSPGSFKNFYKKILYATKYTNPNH